MIDRLSDKELAGFLGQEHLESGRAYTWVMGFGWCSIGYYVKHTTPTKIMVAHCSHFKNANTDYGVLATSGAPESCEWRYEGLVEINLSHVLKTTYYGGVVNRGVKG